jgi:hypothetical protein
MNETVMLKIQCKAPTGETGTFLFDTARGRLVSPVFDGLHDFHLADRGVTLTDR